MAQKLEAFAKKNRIRIRFEHTTVEKITIEAEQKSSTKRADWTCALFPPLFGHAFSYNRPKPLPSGECCGTLFPTQGKTRKQARDKMAKFIRGITLRTGYSLCVNIIVPTDLQ